MQEALDRTIKVSLNSHEGLSFLLICTTDIVVSLDSQTTTNTLKVLTILEDIVEPLHIHSRRLERSRSCLLDAHSSLQDVIYRS